jgi:hypothetical protein
MKKLTAFAGIGSRQTVRRHETFDNRTDSA